MAVPQDREPIGDGEDLVQSVGDEDRGHALLAQAADETEERLYFVIRERARRLVEDQDARIDGERAGDLHQLLLVRSQPFHGESGVEVEPQAVERLAGRASRGAPVHEAHTAHHAMPDEDVLRDRQLRGEGRLLRDRRDALAEGLCRIAEGRLEAVEADRAGVGRTLAGEDLQHRRLAGAVLADQGVNLAGQHLERRSAQGVHAAEAFVDALGLEDRLGGHRRHGAGRRRAPAGPQEAVPT